MPPKRDKSVLKRNLQTSTSDPDAESSVKKPRRSQRINPNADTTPVLDSIPPTISAPPAKHPRKIASPTSSPPLPSDTQVASQIHFTQLQDFKDDVAEEDVWGYLTPMNSAYGEVLTLTKRSTCDKPGPNNKKQKLGAGKKAAAHASGYLIGRHAECDVVVDSLIVSNRHCVIFKETTSSEPLAILEDLSSNGTYINGTIVGRNKRRTLQQGDEITVAGGVVFVFRYPHHGASGRFKESYTLGQRLGSGHFAVVHIATEKSTGTNYAVKIFKKPRLDDKSRLVGLQQEIAVLMSVSHPNVLCLKETFDEEDGVYLVLELASGGELFEYIIQEGKISEDDTRKIFKQLLNGLKYLHERNIVHRDIKPENILLCDDNLTVKLADFGLAKIIGEDSFTTSLCGTPSYVAPEILENQKNRKYSKAVDVWSLGVVLYICLCGFPPFSDELYTEDFPYNLSQQIKRGNPSFPSPYWDHITDEALDLIDRMITVDPDQRITVSRALEHPWMQERKFGGPGESTESLEGAFEGMMVMRRRPERERTLLSNAVRGSATKKEKGRDLVAGEGQGKEKAVEGKTTAFMEVGGKGVDETLYRSGEGKEGGVVEGSLF